jgi:hypothetical protein
MNLQLLVPLLITSLLTMIGWYVLHWFARKRDKEIKQKELRVNYLIEAWRKLEHAANRKGYDAIEYLEKPIADIQLFGTIKQIELAQKIAFDMVENQKGNLTDLLEDLRQDLRKELNLEKASIEIKFLRIPK